MAARIKESLTIANSNAELDDDDPFAEKTKMQSNILNARAKLVKYRKLLKSPIYIIAMVLIPWKKWHYFEKNWTLDEVAEAKLALHEHWLEFYAPIEVTPPTIRVSIPNQSRNILEQMDDSDDDDFSQDCQDEWIAYQAAGREHKGSFVSASQWWQLNQHKYPRLAIMAANILTIPGMSAEVERLFSSTKLMLTDQRASLLPAVIEAAECIGSWKRMGIITSID